MKFIYFFISCIFTSYSKDSSSRYSNSTNKSNVNDQKTSRPTSAPVNIPKGNTSQSSQYYNSKPYSSGSGNSQGNRKTMH